MPSGQQDFDLAIEQLDAAVTVQDPDRFVALLQAYPHATGIQLKRLWQVAVAQSAIGEVARVTGEGTLRTAEWQARWTHGAEALRKALMDVAGDEIGDALTAYAEERRTIAAYPALIARVHHVEALLRGQRSLIGFHHAEDENPYRERERELSDRLVAPATVSAERKVAAQHVIEEIDRYEALYLPKVEAATRDVVRAFEKCTELLPFCSERLHQEIHQWHKLTSELLDARHAAVAHIRHMLRFDRFLPDQMLAGDMETINGAEPVLSEAASEQVVALGEESASLLEQSAHKEADIEAARESSLRDIIGHVTPEPATPEEPLPTTKHPLERKPWYRLAKLCWWSALALWVLFSIVVWPDWLDVAIAIFIGYGVLHGIKAALFYVTLGRTTLRERTGSGFLDLDEFELQVFERNGTTDEEFRKHLSEIRHRYGSRVPAEILRKFVDAQLSNVRTEKRRILSEADKQGKTINLDSLRSRVMAARPQNIDEDEYRLSCERLLLRVELKYGHEIPVSAADAEAESLSTM